MSFLHIQQKAGNADRLQGKLTVYARIDAEPADMLSMSHPVSSAIQNNLLVAQGNFREQNSLKDFLKSEMGVSLEEGLEQLIERMDGLEGALDPDKLREKIENMDEMDEFIPTPAKIVPFASEADIMREEGDIFYVGTFKNIGNAVLSVNSFPIFYQARYREQLTENVRSEIENLIAQIESGASAQSAQSPKSEAPKGSAAVDKQLLNTYIPRLMYLKTSPEQFSAEKKSLYDYLPQEIVRSDIDKICDLIEQTDSFSNKENKLLELYSKKIAALIRNDMFEAEKFRQQIEQIN